MRHAETLSATTIIAALDHAGLRQTRPRKALADHVGRLAATDADFTIEDLWHGVRQTDASVGRATTFRLVEVLVELGLVDRIAFADGSTRYHAVLPGEHHHHLTCERCHKVVEVDMCMPAQQMNEVAHRAGFALSGHRIEIFGCCADCQRQ